MGKIKSLTIPQIRYRWQKEKPFNNATKSVSMVKRKNSQQCYKIGINGKKKKYSIMLQIRYQWQNKNVIRCHKFGI
jgi:hypothetical protein